MNTVQRLTELNARLDEVIGFENKKFANKTLRTSKLNPFKINTKYYAPAVSIRNNKTFDEPTVIPYNYSLPHSDNVSNIRNTIASKLRDYRSRKQ